jgi:hypothetical protein
MWNRLKRALAGTGTAMLAGAFFFVVVGRIDRLPPVGALALIGAVYGAAVLGLVRLFRARTWGLAVAGLLSGPVPVAVLAGSGGSPDERGGIVALAAVLGTLIGLLEWARQAAREKHRDVS